MGNNGWGQGGMNNGWGQGPMNNNGWGQGPMNNGWEETIWVELVEWAWEE